MAGKGTERKGKLKDIKAAVTESDTLTTFTLPDSLPCSEVDFPILLNKRNKANWLQIVEESEKRLKEIDEYTDNKKEPTDKPPFLS